MKICRSPESIIDQVFEVYSWICDHDKQGFFSEEYEGMIAMKEADEYRYLGFVISSSASNVPNILDKKGKVAGTNKTS